MRFSDSGMILCDGRIYNNYIKWHKRIDEYEHIPIHLNVYCDGKIVIYIFDKKKYKEITLTGGIKFFKNNQEKTTMTQEAKLRELISRLKKYETYDNIPIKKIHEFMGELNQIETMKISLDASMIGPALGIGRLKDLLQAEIDRRKKE